MKTTNARNNAFYQHLMVAPSTKGLFDTAHEFCQGNEEIMIAGGLITESEETAGSLRAAFQAANDCKIFITVSKGDGMEMVKQICARMNQFAT